MKRLKISIAPSDVQGFSGIYDNWGERDINFECLRSFKDYNKSTMTQAPVSSLISIERDSFDLRELIERQRPQHCDDRLRQLRAMFKGKRVLEQKSHYKEANNRPSQSFPYPPSTSPGPLLHNLMYSACYLDIR